MPRGEGQFGYAEETVSDDIFIVTFDANGETPTETVESYALYRAAEIAEARAAARFVLLDRILVRDQQVWRDSGLYGAAPYSLTRRSRVYGPLYRPYPVYTSTTSYRAVVKVLLLPEGAAAPEDLPLGAVTMDTSEVISALGPKVARPLEG
jgi:hypothetical protein